jgi:hypothetical protein
MVLVGGDRWVVCNRIWWALLVGNCGVWWTRWLDFELYLWVGVTDGGAEVSFVDVCGCYLVPFIAGIEREVSGSGMGEMEGKK